MPAFDIQYAESETESIFTDDWQDKVSITFTPASTKKYLILASAEWEEESSDDTQEIIITIDSVEKGREVKAGAIARWDPMSFMIFTELDATQHVIKIQYRRLAVKTAKIRRARIIAIDISENAVVYSASEGTSTTTNTNWTDKTSITIPQGTWLIICSGRLGFLVNHKSAGMRVFNSTDSVEYGLVVGDPYNKNVDKIQSMIMRVVTLSAEKVIKLQFKRMADYDVNITYGHLIAINLAKFKSYDYDESEEVSSDSTGNWQTKLTQSFSPSGTIDVLTFYSWETKHLVAVCETQGRKGTTEENYSRDYTSYADFSVAVNIKRASVGTQTFDIRYKTDSGGTSVSMQRARILQLELVKSAFFMSINPSIKRTRIKGRR